MTARIFLAFRNFTYSFVLIFVFKSSGQAPECTQLRVPADGATDVPVTTNFEWEAANRATEYLLTIGTTFGGNDILNTVSVGDATQYQLPGNLPFGQSIYVAIITINNVGANGNCAQLNFTTQTSDGLPPCAVPTSPEHAAQNISTTPNLMWQTVDDADGYLLTIGTTSGDPPILNRFDVGNVTSFTSPTLAQGSTYYFSVIPYNATGNAENCGVQSSFTTQEITVGTDLVCTELLLPENGSESVSLLPELRWRGIVGAEGYWVSVGTETDSQAFLDRLDVGSVTTFQITEALPTATKINVLIVPYNTTDEAEGCSLFSFTTTQIDTPISNLLVPRFFTPNNDGVNDRWSVSSNSEFNVQSVSVFDRYGKLLVQLSPSQEWDGTLNGYNLPSGSYWHSVKIANSGVVRGYFLLKR